MKGTGLGRKGAPRARGPQTKRQVDILAVREELFVEATERQEQRAPVRRGPPAGTEWRWERLVEPRDRLVAEVVGGAERTVDLDTGALDHIRSCFSEQHACDNVDVPGKRLDEGVEEPGLGNDVVVEDDDELALGDRRRTVDRSAEARIEPETDDSRRSVSKFGQGLLGKTVVCDEYFDGVSVRAQHLDELGTSSGPPATDGITTETVGPKRRLGPLDEQSVRPDLVDDVDRSAPG